MSADPARLAVSRDLLIALGVTLDELRDDPADHPSVPTLGEYLPAVVAAAGPGANRTYGSYWTRMATAWGTRPLNEISASDIEAMQHHAAAGARSRRNGRHGRHAGEHVIAAARAIYSRAIADGQSTPGASPAHRVAKPRRLPSTRRALAAHELSRSTRPHAPAGTTSSSTPLLLRLHTETACRRGGALALRLVDLDTDQRPRPTPRERQHRPLAADHPRTSRAALAEHAAAAAPSCRTDRLLRYRDGHPLTSRRYDHLWKRLGQQLPWVAAQGISTHWLRHTTLTWVERHFGYGIARAYAGHTDSTGAATTTYIKADLHAVATALSAMTGQTHPLARS